MVVHPQILDYSMIMYQIIHSFESDTDCLTEFIIEVTFIKVIDLWNRLLDVSY